MIFDKFIGVIKVLLVFTNVVFSYKSVSVNGRNSSGIQFEVNNRTNLKIVNSSENDNGTSKYIGILQSQLKNWSHGITKHNTLRMPARNQSIITLPVNFTELAIGNKNKYNRNRIQSKTMDLTIGTPQYDELMFPEYRNKSKIIQRPIRKKPSNNETNANTSRELKLQFLLDYAILQEKLKSQFESTTKPLVKSNPSVIRPSNKFLNPAQSTKQPVHRILPSITTTTTKKPIVTKKPKIKTIYQDPPVIEYIGDMFDNVYTFMEDSLTISEGKQLSKQRKSQRRHKLAKKLTKRSTLVPVYTVTPDPNQFTQQQFLYNNNPNKNYLSTKIHVTSEYGGGGGGGADGGNLFHPTTIMYPIQQPVRKIISDESTSTSSTSTESMPVTSPNKHINTDAEYYDDEYNEKDDDDYDDRDDNDDDEDDDDDEEYEFGFDFGGEDTGKPPKRIKNSKLLGIKNKINKKINLKKGDKNNDYDKDNEDYEDEDDDDDDDDDDDEDDDDEDTEDEDKQSYFSGIFRNIASSVGNFMPKFPFFSNHKNNRDRNNEKESMEHIEYRKPKNPSIVSYSDFHRDGINLKDPKTKTSSWFNPFSLGTNNDDYDSNDGLQHSTSTSPLIRAEAPSFFNWFGASDDEEPTNSIDENDNENTNWFFGLFGSSPSKKTPSKQSITTTTTTSPFPENWMGLLAQHLVNSTTTTTEKPPKDNVPTRKYYESYQLWRLLPTTEEQLKFLKDYQLSDDGMKLQWWKGPTLKGPTDILLPPNLISTVKDNLYYEDINYEILIWDLEKVIEFENIKLSKDEEIKLEHRQGHPLSWFRYHSYSDIIRFIEYLYRTYPYLVDLIHIGRSFEGRPLVIVKISWNGEPMDSPDEFGKMKSSRRFSKKKMIKRPAILIETGSHGREWIGPATVTWLLNALISEIQQNDTNADTLRKFDWYIMPVLNPDGYEFSHNFDRIWRKSRSKHTDNDQSIFSTAMHWFRTGKKMSNKNCFGTDLNRNWDYKWMENTGASGKSMCNEFYGGPRVFSEPETKALSKFILDNRKQLKIFLSLHSYGQMISYPTAINSSYTALRNNDLLDMAQISLESLRDISNSAQYLIDNSMEMHSSRTGTIDGFAMFEAGIKYSYTIELRDTGTHGFLLPPTYIEQSGKEIYAIVKSMVDYL